MYQSTIVKPTAIPGSKVKVGNQEATVTAVELRYFARVDYGWGDPLGMYVEPDTLGDMVEPPMRGFPDGVELGAKVRVPSEYGREGVVIALINYQGDPVVDVVFKGGGRMAYQARAVEAVPDPRDAVIAAARRWQSEADPDETLTAGEKALADALDALKA